VRGCLGCLAGSAVCIGTITRSLSRARARPIQCLGCLGGCIGGVGLTRALTSGAPARGDNLRAVAGVHRLCLWTHIICAHGGALRDASPRGGQPASDVSVDARTPTRAREQTSLSARVCWRARAKVRKTACLVCQRQRARVCVRASPGVLSVSVRHFAGRQGPRQDTAVLSGCLVRLSGSCLRATRDARAGGGA
jgi:hypothetical protein